MKKKNMIKKTIFILLLIFLSINISIPLFAQCADCADEDFTKEEAMRERLEKGKEKPPEIIAEEGLGIEKPISSLPAEKILIKKISLIGVTLLSKEEINGIILPYENNELSLKEMQKCADLITEAYHQKGYITSRAYIPLQQFEQGILEIRGIEGVA